MGFAFDGGVVVVEMCLNVDIDVLLVSLVGLTSSVTHFVDVFVYGECLCCVVYVYGRDWFQPFIACSGYLKRFRGMKMKHGVQVLDF